MNTTLWILQGVLAAMMLLPGFMKLSNSNQELIKKGNGRMDWAVDVTPTNMKLIGMVEVLASFGLILPMLLGILPILTPIAAVGVIFTMLGALSLHMKRGDNPSTFVPNIVILLIAAFVAYGRFVLIPA
jgi:uncharacterized membrane protein YphA (DoxX/SURF4 family)